MKGRTKFCIQLLRAMRSEEQAEKQKLYLALFSFAVNCSAVYTKENFFFVMYFFTVCPFAIVD